ncbi:HNH endonuclease [Aquipseudomonas alcaligenes]|uniref:HNH endonuclease n=1 Tax=Aquipseudomonas alcaligenes TaxID=43263 RepID=UPI00364778D1
MEGVQFRAIHTSTAWRGRGHESLYNAISCPRRGAIALFNKTNTAIDYELHGDALFAFAWTAHEGYAAKPDGNGGVVVIEVPLDTLVRFDRAKGAARSEVEALFSSSRLVDVESLRSGFWWVNHKQTSKVELAGGYIWSPREKKGGVRNQAYINLTLVRPGDIVISYSDTLIKAIGVARSSFTEATKPAGYGAAGETWNDTGWLVPIDWTYLDVPIRPKDHLGQIAELLPEKYSPLQKATGDGNQSIYLAAISSRLGEVLLALAGASANKVQRLSESYSAGRVPDRSLARLPAEQLRKVSSRHIWQAVQDIIGGLEVPGFGPSTDYDLVTEEGDRLPPKAVFGLAATQALGFQVQPKHFTAGIGSTSFELLASAGYLIVPKGEPAPAPDLQISYEDRVWSEGQQKLVTHLRKERGTGLSKAKKDQFRADHGRLFCERCKLDPVTEYGDAGEACIEVHHSKVQVTDMDEEHQTRLEDLECLCANCHRVEHRLLKQKQVAASGEAVAAHAAVAE